MKLLLDEHYSSAIAKQLRERGHDVTAVQEEVALRGLDDRAVWNHAIAATRALVTENVRHFMPIVLESSLAAERHFGVVFTSPRSMPRGHSTIGIWVERLDEFLRERSAEDALVDQVYWL